MSGHSKWSTIKRKKGAADAKRGAVFTRLTRELVMAAREGGSDPDSNFQLRLAVDKARAENMPKDNIERAIRRGAGEDKDAAAFEQIMYEGYAPHGVAVMVETVTDNRNRTVSDLRHAFSLDPPVPALADLFTPSFEDSIGDDLKTKPKAQASYRDTYHVCLNPVLDEEQFCRFYYQLHKNVDGEMMKVFTALQNSRYKDDTIVVFTSDHGEMLLAHGGMHQKMYQAYDETTRVPLMIWYPKKIAGPRSVDTLTSHADLVPTLLGLAGIDLAAQEEIRQKLSVNHSDAVPFVGRDLSSLILGQVDPASVNNPMYYMTDDDPSRVLHMNKKNGLGYEPVKEPAHVETVIARLADRKVWKFSRYFDNPQYWSSPGTPGSDSDTQDLLRVQIDPDPGPDDWPQPVDVRFQAWAKGTPVPDEFEMYNLTDDPRELENLYNATTPLPEQIVLARSGAAVAYSSVPPLVGSSGLAIDLHFRTSGLQKKTILLASPSHLG